MELTYLTVCTQNTKNIIIKIIMLISGEFFNIFRKHNLIVIQTFNVINSTINVKMLLLVFIYKKCASKHM